MLKKVASFKLAQLKTLVESEDSCVTLVPSHEKTITLFPIHLNNIKESVREILESKVTKYDFELNGIILSHKNVKLMDPKPLDDGGKLKLTMIADIYLFKPSIGSVLKGVVNKKSRDHLGCLVHSIFNVAIPRPPEMDASKPWIGSRLPIGQDISFKVVLMDFGGRLPYIRGKLIETGLNFEDSEGIDSGIGCPESMEEDGVHEHIVKKKKKKDKHKNDEQEIKSSHEESYHEHSPKKKCKKRKASLMDDMENIPNKRMKESSQNHDENGTEEHNRSLCRKKKKKESPDQDCEAPRESEDHNEVHANEHKKKKRKRSFTEDISEPVLKKSRKESLGSDSNIETSLNSHKKKKRKDSTTEDLISSLLHETEMRLMSPPPNKSLNSSLKKSKLQGSIESITSELLKDALSNSFAEGDSSISKKKKKKKKESFDRAIEPFITSTPQTDPVFKPPNHSGLDTSVLNDSTETTSKKKKKKRNSIIDSDSQNVNDLSISESKSILDDFTTPKLKKKKKRKSFSEDLESMTASLLAEAVKELK